MASQSIRNYGTCDEGGVHDFRLPAKSSGCCKCLCCPCYLICGLALSRGAGLASAPIGFNAGDDRPDEIICTKCGLTPSEASALSQAKDAEAHGFATSKGPGYFSNAGMSIPAPPASMRSPSQRRSRPPSAAAYPPSPEPSHAHSGTPSHAYHPSRAYPTSHNPAHQRARPPSGVPQEYSHQTAPSYPESQYGHEQPPRPAHQQQYQHVEQSPPHAQQYPYPHPPVQGQHAPLPFPSAATVAGTQAPR